MFKVILFEIVSKSFEFTFFLLRVFVKKSSVVLFPFKSQQEPVENEHQSP